MDFLNFISTYRWYILLTALVLAATLVALVIRSALQDLQAEEEQYGGIYIPDEQHTSPQTKEQHG